MPNGQYPVILAGQVLTAGLLQGFAPLTAYKAADTSRATFTTLTNDPDLSVPVAINGWYFMACAINYEGGTQGASDLSFAWSVPAGTTMSYELLGITTAGASTIGFARGASGSTLGTSGAGNRWQALMVGTVKVGGTAGNLVFQWAQNTSSATPTIVHTGGSVLALWRMA